MRFTKKIRFYPKPNIKKSGNSVIIKKVADGVYITKKSCGNVHIINGVRIRNLGELYINI